MFRNKNNNLGATSVLHSAATIGRRTSKNNREIRNCNVYANRCGDYLLCISCRIDSSHLLRIRQWYLKLVLSREIYVIIWHRNYLYNDDAKSYLCAQAKFHIKIHNSPTKLSYVSIAIVSIIGVENPNLPQLTIWIQ